MTHFKIFFSSKKIDKNDIYEIYSEKYKNILLDFLSLDLLDVDSIRQFIKKHSTKNLSGEKRILIIQGLSITNQAQNSLLKFTEEPPESTILLLFLPEGTNILPTLISRSGKIEHFEKVDLTPYNKKFEINSFLKLNHKKRLEIYKTIEDLDSPIRKKIIRNLIDNVMDMAKKNQISLSQHFIIRIPVFNEFLNKSSTNTKILYEEIALLLDVID